MIETLKGVKMYAELILKKCAECIEKPTSEFYKRKASKDGFSRLCKKCEDKRHTEYRSDGTVKSKLSLKQKEWRANNKERIAKQKRQHKFGISPEEQDRMLEAQGYKCAICKVPESELRRRLALDHCHKTDLVRGFLCDTCNRGLGLLKDNIAVLEAAIVYLKKYQK